jgi:hypothetical protein
MAFTTIDINTSWQDLAIAIEIANSYNLRRRLKNLEVIAVPTHDTLVFDFIFAIQTGLEEMANDRWMNNSGAIVDYKLGSSGSIAAETTADLMALAGMTSTGYWRRVPVDGDAPADWTDYGDAVYSYGKIEDGDLAGPWLFKDIQLLMEKMTRHIWSSDLDYRAKAATDSDSTPPIPSTALTWSEWAYGGYPDFWRNTYYVAKRKNGTTITTARGFVEINEFAYSLENDIAELETDRGAFVLVDISSTFSYTDLGGKFYFDELGSDSVLDLNGKYGMNSFIKDDPGELTTVYHSVLAEDAETLDTILNAMLPDANVPDEAQTKDFGIYFYRPIIVMDFTFE